MNELLNRKSKATTINEINVNGGKIVGDKSIANEFNKYFSEIGKKLASEIPQNDMNPLDLVITYSVKLIYLLINTKRGLMSCHFLYESK
jgi:hypothetical protein